ncbi:MAG: VanZ family protein [Turicibacter sanguinis]
MGRSSDIDDLILNTLGGIIGYGIFILFNKWLSTQNWWKNLLQ